VTVPFEFLIWSGVAATVAVHVRSLQLPIVKAPEIPLIFAFMPSLAPLDLPRPTVISVPPATT
jgi:hypothetical protein